MSCDKPNFIHAMQDRELTPQMVVELGTRNSTLASYAAAVRTKEVVIYCTNCGMGPEKHVTASRQTVNRDIQNPSKNGCPEKNKPGGCQLPNVHCGYPQCDQ